MFISHALINHFCLVSIVESAWMISSMGIERANKDRLRNSYCKVIIALVKRLPILNAINHGKVTLTKLVVLLLLKNAVLHYYIYL
jgi:hypothetical protein